MCRISSYTLPYRYVDRRERRLWRKSPAARLHPRRQSVPSHTSPRPWTDGPEREVSLNCYSTRFISVLPGAITASSFHIPTRNHLTGEQEFRRPEQIILVFGFSDDSSVGRSIFKREPKCRRNKGPGRTHTCTHHMRTLARTWQTRQSDQAGPKMQLPKDQRRARVHIVLL